MTLRVAIKPELFNWAIERSGVDGFALRKRFGKLDDWLAQTLQPTFKQAEAFAKATYTPIGFLFLVEPPDEKVPIPDFRTLADTEITRPSVNLLDTIYSCEQRQYWYREYLLSHGDEANAFVGSLSVNDAVPESAAIISQAIGFDVAQRVNFATWEQALNEFMDLAERAGILVMRSGIVDNNTRRKLAVEEFRGFALVDDFAPLVFINGADSKSAQMFTLAHELAHIWLGQTALSSPSMSHFAEHNTELWCNQVAAELLAPMQHLREQLEPDEDIAKTLSRLSKLYKVSALVVMRRLYDAGHIDKSDFLALYQQECQRFAEFQKNQSGGGDFYRNQRRKLSSTFARALIGSALEGQTSYRDAMRMLGVRKTSTFKELGRQLEVLF